MTFRNRAVISSATRTAQWSKVGSRFRSTSQYSMQRIMWLSSTRPSIISTSYLLSISESCKSRSSRPAFGCILSVSLRTRSPSPRIERSLAITSRSQASSNSGWSFSQIFVALAYWRLLTIFPPGSWVGHVLGLDEGVEFFGGDVAEFEGGVAEADLGVVGGFGDLGGVVVADLGDEGGDEHHGIVDILVDLFAVGFDADDAVLDEAVAGVGEEFDGVQIIENHHGLEDVELEIALRAGEADGGIIAHHLHGNHGQGFGLRGIYFAGHDGGAGLVFGKREFAEAAARAGGEPANVVGNFHERSEESFQSAAGENDFVVRGKRGEFVGMRAEGQAGELGDFLCGALGKFGMSVEAGADGGAADGEIIETIESDGDAAAVAVKEIHPAGKFLAEREGRGVLQMRPADLNDASVFLGFGVEGIAKILHGGKQAARGFRGGSDVHGGRKGVIGGLRHVYIIIWVDRFLAAHDPAGDFDGAIGDDLVDVHVGLRAAAGLPDAQREVLVEFSGDDFISGLDNELGFFGGELAEILIDERGGLLEDAEGANELGRHGVLADSEVDERAGGLRAVIAVGRDFDCAHGVGFGASRRLHDGFGSFRHGKLLVRLLP